MKPDKRKRLAAAGWKTGRAKEFLGLTEEEDALIELRLALAGLLRQVRVEREATQAQLAEWVRSSQSRVAKMEAGDASVSADLMLRALFVLGVTFQDLGKLLSGMRSGGPQRRSRRGKGRPPKS